MPTCTKCNDTKYVEDTCPSFGCRWGYREEYCPACSGTGYDRNAPFGSQRCTACTFGRIQVRCGCNNGKVSHRCWC